MAGILLIPMSMQAAARVVEGLTEPLINIILSSPVNGIISAKNFKEGDHVKKGDVILELDKRIEELEVDRRELVMVMRKSDLVATQVLFEKTKSVSQEELDQKQADYSVAVVEHKMAQEQLRRRLIIAPHDGILTDILLDEGEAAEAQQSVIRLVDPRQCFFECDVEASDAQALKLNLQIQLEIDTGAIPAQVKGKIVFLSPVADPASGLIKVRPLLDRCSESFPKVTLDHHTFEWRLDHRLIQSVPNQIQPGLGLIGQGL